MARALPSLAAFLTTVLVAPSCVHRAPVHPRAAEEIVRGYGHLKAGDAERAEIAFEHALAFDPEIPEALNGLGVVARRRGRNGEARRRFEQAISAKPDFAEARTNLGETLFATGDAVAAIAEFERALAIDPDLADARMNLARALVRRGLDAPPHRAAAFARARRELLHCLESDERRAAAHHDLGFLEFHAGRFAEAERSYRRAAELAPSAEALHGLCISLVRLDRCGEGAKACERCLEASPAAERCRTSLRGARACAR
jgi:Tfp pilus assembly protein PilF